MSNVNTSEKMLITKALNAQYMLFVHRNHNESSDSGIFSVRFDKDYFDKSPQADIKSYINNYKKLVYSLLPDQNVTFLKAKGNGTVLVVGSVITSSSDNQSTVLLDVLNASQNFKRCREALVKGEVTELDILIPDDQKEKAELIYFVKRLDTSQDLERSIGIIDIEAERHGCLEDLN